MNQLNGFIGVNFSIDAVFHQTWCADGQNATRMLAKLALNYREQHRSVSNNQKKWHQLNYFRPSNSLVTSKRRGLSGVPQKPRRPSAGQGCRLLNCPMWIYCRGFSVPARTAAGSGTSAAHLTVGERGKKSKDVERNLTMMTLTLKSTIFAPSSFFVLDRGLTSLNTTEAKPKSQLLSMGYYESKRGRAEWITE